MLKTALKTTGIAVCVKEQTGGSLMAGLIRVKRHTVGISRLYNDRRVTPGFLMAVVIDSWRSHAFIRS